MFYSKTTGGFYSDELHEAKPQDSVEITTEYWQELLASQAEGKVIEADSAGYPIAVDIPLTKDQTIANINSAIQLALDSGAQDWGYNSIVSGASYATSPNPQYSADANALIEWRDDVWQWAYPKYPSVTPGETPAEFMVDMPAQPSKPVV